MEMKIDFEQCVQDSQDFGSDDEHMVSRVFFSLQVDGALHGGLHSNIKQTVGSDYETGAIEVSAPVGYNGPLDYGIFRKAVERYYRSLVGSQGSGIRIGAGSGIRMRNNIFASPATFHVFHKEAFKDTTVVIDGKIFLECELKNCTIRYGGTNLVDLDASTLDGCRWEFVGPARMTLDLMRGLYHAGGSNVIDQIFEDIRRKPEQKGKGRPKPASLFRYPEEGCYKDSHSTTVVVLASTSCGGLSEE